MRLVCICPNPAIDHTVVVPGLVTGETIRAIESMTTAGGKGLNVARFARGFGAAVTSVAWLGELGADLMYDLARRDDLNLRASVVPSVTVRVCPVLVDQGDGSVLTTSDPPPRLDAAMWATFVELAASEVLDADVVCVAGSFPRVQDTDAVRSLLEAVGAVAAPVWVDSSDAALATVSDGFPSLGLKVNLAEAHALLGARGDRGALSNRAPLRAQALAAAEALSRGVRPVVVTAGAAGAAEATAAGSRWQDAPVVEVRNPTGSGDAFLAGYLCAGRGLLGALDDPLLAGVLAGAVNARSWAPVAPAKSLLALAGEAPGPAPE